MPANRWEWLPDPLRWQVTSRQGLSLGVEGLVDMAGVSSRNREDEMDTTTLLIIIFVIIVLESVETYQRGPWF